MGKPADILPRLQEWADIYAQWHAQYEAIQALTKCGPDVPLTRATGMLWDVYTKAVAREIGDENEWLDWYCWENDMGAKGMRVTSTSGKTINVRTLRQLARVICY